ncbi:MAG: uridine kinase [Acidobacteria bacterium]|nr:MAG: uridine kinase [Acidobacteriota bacterium]
MVPYATVVGLGGRSVLDRGRAAVFPLVDEIVANKRHKMIVAVSGGARMRHVYQIALDLGIPTGGLAMLAGGSEEQYAVMLQALLARHGGAAMPRDHFGDLPLWLQSGIIPIVISMPPYHYWEPPSARGRLPHNGSDLGVYMTAEALGVKAMIFVKDRDGLYTDDPETNPQAELIPRIGARCLLARELPSLIIDRAVVETLRNARFIKRVQIINGLRPGNLTRALEGEPVGTIIEKD